MIFVGNGVTQAEAGDELRSVAELLGAPVATTLMAKGIFPEDHALSVGMTGIWGTRAANETTRTADVIIAVGTAFGEADCSSWRPEYTFEIPGSKLIQIDIDPGEIGKSYPTTMFYDATGKLQYVHQGPYPTEGALATDIQRYAVHPS